MTLPEPEVRIIRYEVSCLPRDHEDASIFTVVVENVGNADQWAVKHGTSTIAADLTRSWGRPWLNGKEPETDEEIEADEKAHDEWMAGRRFDHDTALRIAGEYAPQIRYRDYTVADALSRIAEREAGV